MDNLYGLVIVILYCIYTIGIVAYFLAKTENLPLTEIYVVGRSFGEGKWELRGIFSDVNIASANCVKNNDFIGPVILNCPLPDETLSWPGIIWPRASDDCK